MLVAASHQPGREAKCSGSYLRLAGLAHSYRTARRKLGQTCILALGPEQRNILRRLFFDPQVRGVIDWESAARFAVASFRADTARAGASANVQTLVDELRRSSPEFERLWGENDVRTHGEGTKHFRHPVAGMLEVEYSAFSIDGRPELNLVIYNPATPKDVNRIRKLIALTQKSTERHSRTKDRQISRKDAKRRRILNRS